MYEINIYNPLKFPPRILDMVELILRETATSLLLPMSLLALSTILRDNDAYPTCTGVFPTERNELELVGTPLPYARGAKYTGTLFNPVCIVFRDLFFCAKSFVFIPHTLRISLLSSFLHISIFWIIREMSRDHYLVY